MERKNLNISGELHAFLKRKASESDNIKNKVGISDLGEAAIRCHFGVDEDGKPILNPKDVNNRIHLGGVF